jgi:CheY-like chemotaxis protein/HPt (histidine-containing phosphotransfer) domain-containing protein
LLQHIANCTREQAAADLGPPVGGGLTPRPMIEFVNRPGQQRPLTSLREASRPTQGASLDQQQAVLRVYRKLDRGQGTDQDQRVIVHDGRPRLLLGQQHPTTQTAMRDALEAEGCVVDVANDGQKTLAAFIMNEYDLLLVNDRMPALSGIEIAHAIRSLEGRKRRVPIVALVESAAHLLKRDLTEAGINGYLTKPVDTNALLVCVRHHLPRKVAMQRNTQPDGIGQAPDIETLCKVAKLFAPGAMVRFLSSLTMAVEEMLPMLHGGWVVATPDDIARRAHSLAGTAGTLGCVALSTAARALETDHAGSTETQQRFIATAHATLRVVRAYMAP